MSTIPQNIQGYHTVSNVWGEAFNAINNDFLLGGSSGGAAGLVAT